MLYRASRRSLLLFSYRWLKVLLERFSVCPPAVAWGPFRVKSIGFLGAVSQARNCPCSLNRPS